MSHRDSVPDELRLWRAAGVPLDSDLQEACRPATVDAITRAMMGAQRSRTRQQWVRRALFAAMVGAMSVGALLVATRGPVVEDETRVAAVVVEARAHAERGSVEIDRASEHHVLTGDRSMALSAGDVIHVGSSGSLVVTLPNSGTSEWQAGTELDVREVAVDRQGFTLRKGHVAVEIPPDAPPRHLVVTTPHVDVVVVGTVFDVSVSEERGEQVTEVSVERGHVRLTHEGRTVAHLTAGQSWSSRHRQAAQRPDEPRETETVVRRPTASQVEASTLKEQNRIYRAALDARNAGRDERTVTLLTQLLTQHPESPLAQEAKVERFRALERLGRTEEASQAARRYLAEHGDGFAREEAREAALAASPSSK